jgi:hypothetical protein
MKTFVQQELIRRGILWSGTHNLCFSHTEEDVDHTIDAYFEVLALLRDGVNKGTLADQLEGEPVEPVFRRTSHFNTKPAPAGARQ